MALSAGDYKAVEDQAVAVLLADTGPGGLKETGHPAVATISAGDPGIVQRFGLSDYPAILVRVMSKSESPAQPVYSVIKTYTVRAMILARGLDRADAEESVRQIAARLEVVLRNQTATDQQFQGLPDLIDAAEGVLACLLRETSFAETQAFSDHVIAQALVTFEIQAPCAFRYE